jgi:hypothetical protein
LNITGRPCLRQNSIASSGVVTGPGVPGTTATPQTNTQQHYFQIMQLQREIHFFVLKLSVKLYFTVLETINITFIMSKLN